MDTLRKAYSLFCKFEELLVSATILGVTGLVFGAAMARFIGSPLAWAIDLSLLLFAWLTFLGASVALKKADFMSVGLLITKFPERIQKVLYYLFSLMAIAFLLVVIWQGTSLAIEGATRLFQGLGISYSWATMSAPVGSSLMIITIVLRLVERRRDEGIIVEGREAI